MTTTLILTTTVHIQSHKSFLYQVDPARRLETYLTSIRQWLAKTSFPILVVENSGYAFDELQQEKEIYKDRFEIISFVEEEQEDAKYLQGNNSKGASEVFAIHYAFKHSTRIHSSIFILKITGRFFIPELEKYLQQYRLEDYDCLTQSYRNRCEMVGCHYKHFAEVFDIHLLDDEGKYNPHVESIWQMRTSKYAKVLVCKTFIIDSTQRGGVQQCYTTI